MELNKIYNMDCLEGLKQLEDNSIDLVVTDPPYFEIMKQDHKGNKYEWDKQWINFREYLDWVCEIAIECRRVLKDNGSLYMFADDKICAYVQVELDKYFNLENNITWVKPNNMTIKGWNNFRCYAPITERLLFYSQKWDINSGKLISDKILEENLKPNNNFSKYLRNEFQKAGVSNKEISKLFPSKTGGLTGCVSNWLNGDNIITKEQYLKIKKYLNNEYLKTEYEDLKTEYEDLRRPFNPAKNFTDVWTFNIIGGKENVDHPTQKPIKLIQRIINTSSNKTDIILDPFMGSGTTAVACKELDRKYIGFEISKDYCDIAEKRLKKVNNKKLKEWFK